MVYYVDVIPGGIIICFPSYSLLELTYNYWKEKKKQERLDGEWIDEEIIGEGVNNKDENGEYDYCDYYFNNKRMFKESKDKT